MASAQDWTWPSAARRTPPERLHVTLHFLGNVPLETVPALRQALDLRWHGCELLLDRAEVWRGGMAVLEASSVPPPLADLHARMGEALRRLNLPVEERRYRPHLTLARNAEGAQPPATGPAIRWPTGAGFRLVRSLPGGRGYEPVQLFG